ncbi:MAG: hypothetical protein M1833_005062 [Piccolia ochrophora]|nr:MAG: hypothetical protein M1833_005062 [Piccolia ochrophora]
MAPAVHASSLTELTTIASNPPRYPRNPTQAVHDPLVLYIARVPGSRDVFLTTIKPREKVVTAEDISSSLYYIHVHQPEDDVLIESVTEAERSLGSTERPENGVTGVPRKPLPPGAQVEREPPPKQYPYYQPSAGGINGSTQLGRKAHADHWASVGKTPGAIPRSSQWMHAEESIPWPVQGDRGMLGRKPLGPRPQVAPNQTSSPRCGGIENAPPRSTRPAYFGEVDLWEKAPELPPRPPKSNGLAARDDRPRSSYQSDLRYSLDAPSLLEESTRDTSRQITLTLTLIRRDPTSGGQWNVGKIGSQTRRSSASAAEERYTFDQSLPVLKESRLPIDVEITNPGYNKFIVDSPELFPSSNGNLHPSLIQGPQSALSNLGKESVFRRQITVEGSGFWNRNFWRRRQNSMPTDDADTSGNTINVESSERTSTERPLTARPPLMNGPASSSAVDKGRAKAKAKGYVLSSPWDGLCEFSTGGGGRILKCKHTLPPLNGSAVQTSATVSELRFNLPQSATSAPPSAVATPSVEEKGSRRVSFFSGHNFHKRQSSQNTVTTSTATDDEGGRFDLSLGQEKAGGGTRGKRAKLGKLIVEDEGLRMIDLLVAANMAVWWQVYDRTDIGSDS